MCKLMISILDDTLLRLQIFFILAWSNSLDWSKHAKKQVEFEFEWQMLMIVDHA